MDSNDLDDYETVVGWVRQLAPNTTVPWHDVAQVLADVHTNWVDVSVEGFDALNWLWTIEGEPDELTLADPTVFEVPFDRNLWAVWDDEVRWMIPEAAVSVAAGVPLSCTEIDALEAVVAEHPDRRRLHRSDAWSSAAINRALGEWCRDHAGRDDISFAYDDAAGDASAKALVERLADGRTGELYMLDVDVDDDVTDPFIRVDPHEAAQLTRPLRNELESSTPYGSGTTEG